MNSQNQIKSALMKRLLSLFAIVVLAGLVSAPSVAHSALLSHWDFEGDTTVATDKEGSNNGTLIGNASFFDDGGARGRVLDLDGTGDYADFGDVLDLTGAFTLAAFVRRQADVAAGISDAIFGVMGKEGSSGTTGYAIEVRDSTAPSTNGAIRVLSGGGSPNNTQTAAGAIPNDDQWHHIAYTYESGPGHKIYLDGSLILTTAATGNFGGNSVSFKIGFTQFSGNRDNYWSGLLDDVRVYDEALDAEAIFAIVNPTSTPEPSSFALAALGLLGMVGAGRRRRRNR